MNPRQWDEIRSAFDKVVELGDAERAQWLAALSTTDPELREAVDVLLRADADANAWLAPVESPLGVAPTPDGENAHSVSPDLQGRLQNALGSAYRIVRELGGGGMSHVYVAEETAFRRKIVIKVLRPALAEAISAKRFQREIQLAARLQHSHIVPLLSAGEADGLLYYTMPFVEGESLRDRLRREGELPIDDTVRIVRDVASALAYAHRHGIVHRDIKPENVLLSEGGAVVADFGIAKALSASRTSADEATTTITQRGMALGTPQYMAPEQAAADPGADHRVDLYALGAVAYEMLAGRPPFEGRSAQQLMAAHATEEPDPVIRRRPNTPPQLATLVMRCLEKRRADRPRDAEQILLTLDHAASTASASPLPSVRVDTAAARPVRRWASMLPWALAAVLASVVAGLVIGTWPRSRPHVELSWFDLVLPDSATPWRPSDPSFPSIALSPDGSVIAYIGASTRSLFLRRLDDRLPQRLDGTEGAECVSFSPDGRWITFVSKFRLKKVAIRGGSPITLADSAAGCGAWTESNEIVFLWGGPLYRVSADGGPISLVTRGDSSQGIRNMVPTHALPGGNAVLVCMSGGLRGTYQLGVVSLSSARITQLTERISYPAPPGLERCPAQYANGYVVFAQNRTLFAAPFSLRALRFTGPEVPLLRDTLASFATAGSRTLAFISTTPQSYSLVAVGEGGKTRTLAGNAAAARLGESAAMLLDTAFYAWPRLSPDGRRVALHLYNTREGIWVYDIPSGTLSRLNTNFRGIQPVGWTPDGRSVVYIQIDSGNIGGPRRVVSQAWDGSEPAREFMRLPESHAGSINTMFDISIGPPHGYAAFVVANFSDTADIWITPLDTPTASPLVTTRARDWQPRLSPDGRLLAYTTNETGHFEVVVRSVLGPSTRLQVSRGGGWQPLWSRDGRQLFYRSPGFMMRAIIGRGSEPSVVRRDTLFKDVFNQHDVVNYDVFPNGRELLMIRPNPPGPVHATVVLNWPELLRRKREPR